MTVDELYEWLGKAQRKDEALYHEGHLSVDRLRSRQLCQLADACMRLQGDKHVTITQRRVDGKQWQYIIQVAAQMTPRQIVDQIIKSPVGKKR